MIFTNRIKPLINMFYYTDTGALRFLAWAKAKPDYYNIDFNSKIVNKEIEIVNKEIERIDETNFNNFEELQKIWRY